MVQLASNSNTNSTSEGETSDPDGGRSGHELETQIKRRTLAVDIGDSHIEVALDDGHIVIGNQRVPLKEVELELKSGSEPDLCDLALKLVEDLPLQLDFVSKAEKGFRLISRES